MKAYIIIAVIALTFLCTWIIMCCLWAASEADKDENNENDKENDDDL